MSIEPESGWFPCPSQGRVRSTNARSTRGSPVPCATASCSAPQTPWSCSAEDSWMDPSLGKLLLG